MATFTYNYLLESDAGTGLLNFTTAREEPAPLPALNDEFDFGGSPLDGTDPTQFEIGEFLTIENGGAAFEYEGTVDISGEIFIVTTNPNNGDYTLFGNVADPDTFSPGTSWDTGDINATDVDPSTICFAAGTLVDTPSGPRAVETLGIGDLVLTADGGPQPVRWIGTRSLPRVTPAFAPVRIPAGAFGPGCPSRDVVVSPTHRVLVSGPRARALTGEDEVLVAARDLGFGRVVGPVTYVHVLFDAHQVVTTHGLRSESFHPGANGLGNLEAVQRFELLTLFPALATSPGFGPPARPVVDAVVGSLLGGAGALQVAG